MVRSALAILAGIAVLSLTSFAIEAVAKPALGEGFTGTAVMYAYTTLCIMAGGYATAWVARRAQIRHAIIMGVIQVALTVMAMVSYPNMAPPVQWIAGMALIVPAAYAGGYLQARQARG